MAGGIGSRFWPKSRVAYPKQFLDILGLGKSLIQLTYDRFADIVPKENIFVVTNDSYVDLVKEQLPELSDNQILNEPSRQNTAPCVAYAANKIKSLNPNACIVVAPSDHLIVDTKAFEATILKGLNYTAANKALLTLGIVPTRPDTGYGYIQYYKEHDDDGVFKVKTFTEKPNLKTAEEFIESGDFLWNSGIFVWHVNSIIKAFEHYLPDMQEIFSEGEALYNTAEEQSFINKAYSKCVNISIDYGILEKADNVYVIPSEFGWSDLGTWESLYQHHDKDTVGNALSGQAIMAIDSSNSIIMAPNNKLVVVQGLDGYCVIDTEDVLLICRRDKEQEIKQYTAEIKKTKGESFL